MTCNSISDLSYNIGLVTEIFSSSVSGLDRTSSAVSSMGIVILRFDEIFFLQFLQNGNIRTSSFLFILQGARYSTGTQNGLNESFAEQDPGMFLSEEYREACSVLR